MFRKYVSCYLDNLHYPRYVGSLICVAGVLPPDIFSIADGGRICKGNGAVEKGFLRSMLNEEAGNFVPTWHEVENAPSSLN